MLALVIGGALLTCMSSGGATREVPVNGIIGFSTGSPSIDRLALAVRCGYVPGPRVGGSGTGVMELLFWLRGLEIVVAEPLLPVF